MHSSLGLEAGEGLEAKLKQTAKVEKIQYQMIS